VIQIVSAAPIVLRAIALRALALRRGRSGESPGKEKKKGFCGCCLAHRVSP
jgi:hypothetical protein